MQTVKLKTAELTGAALDWSVAKAAGREVSTTLGFASKTDGSQKSGYWCWDGKTNKPYCPSQNWAQAGPLIEKYKPVISPNNDGSWMCAIPAFNYHRFDDKSLLIAFCRCLVMLKLGDEVEVPGELVK